MTMDITRDIRDSAIELEGGSGELDPLMHGVIHIDVTTAVHSLEPIAPLVHEEAETYPTGV